ncbi:PleD family two-component system response regulator [soil metagenome]
MNTGATVFVADDNSVLLQGLERALSSNDCRVRTASTGRQMIELLENERTPPDLLLLDVMMPEMTGLEVLQHVHADSRWSDLPVMLITASEDEVLPIVALQGGAVDFLSKPFRLGELLARVESHIGRSRQLVAARREAGLRRRMSEVVRDLNRAITAKEMFDLVTDRLAEIWQVRRCSVVVYDSEERGRVVSSSDVQQTAGLVLELRSYPEIRAALDAGAPLLVQDVSTSPIFEELHAEWAREQLSPPLTSVVVVPLCIAEATRGALVLRSADGEPPLHEEAMSGAAQVVEGMIHAVGRAQMYEILLEERHRLDTLAHTDELTGCATRRAVFRMLEEELLLARRHENPLSVVLLDLDHLKQINDSYGHQAGDAVLRRVGQWLHGEGGLRSRDYAGRYGGDEFMVVLPQTDAAGALAFAERARRNFASIVSPLNGSSRPPSFSIGIACIAAGDGESSSPADVIARADAALYEAKQAGRDAIRIASYAAEIPVPTPTG